MMETLADERCGLYFLAGVDTTAPDAGVVTVHAAEGALNHGHQYFIESTFAALYPGYDVRLRLHSNEDLHAPDSLESFARCFQHDHIVADPTGAFARVSKLLELAGQIRAELGSSVGHILWQADASALVVLAAPFNARSSASREKDSFDHLRNEVGALVKRRAPADLRKAIRSVHVSRKVPTGRYTLIDRGPVVAPARKSSVSGMLARISGIAALIGLGTMSAAAAHAPTVIEDDQLQMPGITGLVGLTTLGENSYGLRNRYQAVGGLRLYFRETGTLMTPAATPNPVCADDCEMFDEPEIDMPATHGPEGDGPEIDESHQSEPTLPAPIHVAYGT